MQIKVFRRLHPKEHVCLLVSSEGSFHEFSLTFEETEALAKEAGAVVRANQLRTIKTNMDERKSNG